MSDGYARAAHLLNTAVGLVDDAASTVPTAELSDEARDVLLALEALHRRVERDAWNDRVLRLHIASAVRVDYDRRF